VRRTTRDGDGTSHGQIAQAELLKLEKSGQFSDESVRIKASQIHYVTPRRTNNTKDKGDHVRGTIIIVSVIPSYFVSDSLILWTI
jgi:hypothetical protein